MGLFKRSMSSFCRGHQANQKGRWKGYQEVLNQKDFPRLERQQSGEPIVSIRKAVLINVKLSTDYTEGQLEAQQPVRYLGEKPILETLWNKFVHLHANMCASFNMNGVRLLIKAKSENQPMYICYCVCKAVYWAPGQPDWCCFLLFSFHHLSWCVCVPPHVAPHLPHQKRKSVLFSFPDSLVHGPSPS